MLVSEDPVINEQFYFATIDQVWEALTNVDQMRLWFFDNIENFELRQGFKTSFLVKNEERSFTHLWEITEVIASEKLSYEWKYAEYEGNSFVHFQLTEMNGGVKLTLTVEVVKDFDATIPEFERQSCVQGWNYFLGQRLRDYLITINKA